MYSVGIGFVLLLALGFGAIAVPIVAVLLLWKLCQGLGYCVGGAFRGVAFLFVHVFRFLSGTIVDSLRFVGGILTALFFLPLCIFNLLVFRWRAAGHYAGAVEDELTGSLLALYRVALGHPIRFLGLTALTEGLERRVPDVIARAPHTAPARTGRRAKAAAREFPGYTILSKMKSGGSGGRLFLAEPSREKLAAFQAGGHPDPGKVVIKSFALSEGSTLPQIVRESRALEAAKQLGLVLEHELTPIRFHYVMPFVEGDELSVVATRMHRASGTEGLKDRHLALAMAYTADLLASLDQFHRAGLWHKDIKPSNVLVSRGRVHLVDLGLVTPLQSAMTLTTHGTEYFRDPEMVKLAMNGVKVHEVDGVKFDIYSAGAVLYSLIEDSFPAHGSLSRVSKRCPESLQWVIRRAMADMDGRYGSVQEMLADLRAIIAARKPFDVRPATLPSFSGQPLPPMEAPPEPFVHRPRPVRAAASAPPPTGEVKRQRRTRRRVAAGLLMPFLLLGAMAVMGLAFVRLASSVDRGPVTVVRSSDDRSDDFQETVSWAGLILRGGESLPESQPRRLSERASPSRNKVLVVNHARPQHRLEVSEAVFELLSGQGYEVYGLGYQTTEDGRELEDELSAEIQSEIGASGRPDDPHTVGEIDRFVDRYGQVDYVLWITRGEDGEDLQLATFDGLRRSAVSYH